MSRGHVFGFLVGTSCVPQAVGWNSNLLCHWMVKCWVLGLAICTISRDLQSCCSSDT